MERTAKSPAEVATATAKLLFVSKLPPMNMDAFDNLYTKHGKSISLSEAAMTYIDSFE